MQYNFIMKTATLPAVRVEPALRAEVEALLGDNESLSEFVETSVIERLQRRRYQAAFVARGIASLENARLTDSYVDADALVQTLERKLAVARGRATAGRQ